jgi:hypothetical protein
MKRTASPDLNRRVLVIIEPPRGCQRWPRGSAIYRYRAAARLRHVTDEEPGYVPYFAWGCFAKGNFRVPPPQRSCWAMAQRVGTQIAELPFNTRDVAFAGTEHCLREAGGVAPVTARARNLPPRMCSIAGDNAGSAAQIWRYGCTGPANTHFAGQPDRRNTAPVASELACPR